MLYVGNFSYSDSNDAAQNYCLMPCVVEAQDAEEALQKFADLFQQVRADSDLLDGAQQIYLDSLVELEGMPDEPVLTQWQKVVPCRDGLCSITSVAPVADDEGVAAYAWSYEEDADEDTGETDEPDVAEPDRYGDDTDSDVTRYVTDEDVEADYDEEPFITFE